MGLGDAVTLDEIETDARRFSSLAGWKKASKSVKPNPWLKAKKIGGNFYTKCTSHMTRWLKYSDDEIIDCLKKYETYAAACHGDLAAVRAAKIRSIPTLHLTRFSPISDIEIRASALKYQHKKEWVENDRRAHNAARRRGKDFYEKCTSHMVPAKNPWFGTYVVYAYEFADNYAYVGLTCDPTTRELGHRLKGPVFSHKRETGLAPTRVALEEFIPSPLEAQKAEAEWQGVYATRGWKPLHSAKPGALGAVFRWRRSTLLVNAKKFGRVCDWKLRSFGAYKAAKRLGCFDECTAHMKKSARRRWTSETATEDAARFSSRLEWAKRGWPSYCYASQKGWRRQICDLYGWDDVNKCKRDVKWMANGR